LCSPHKRKCDEAEENTPRVPDNLCGKIQSEPVPFSALLPASNSVFLGAAYRRPAKKQPETVFDTLRFLPENLKKKSKKMMRNKLFPSP
jgi:hypothetical protein